VGAALISRLLADPQFGAAEIVALCHNRTLPPHPRVAIVRGSIGDEKCVAEAMSGVTHVFHLATVKEDAAQVIDISIKGLFLLLEAARTSPTLRQFVLVGGDAAVGHCLVPRELPVTEASPHRAYPGVYAFSKVLEEVMVEQYREQYELRTTILRAPWIMEKDDFRFALSFGPDQFGGPSWDTLISKEERERFATENCVPLLLDTGGGPLRRNFVHLSDLVEALITVIDNPAAIGEMFNIAMTIPVDYSQVASILAATRQMRPVEIKTSFHSNFLSTDKARQRLRWLPKVELPQLIESAFSYQRRADDPRKIWYQG
ncbi:MAG: NAD(P)-dependent oxidoreductase, partial [Devosia sp.]